jgi:hypothetical protein
MKSMAYNGQVQTKVTFKQLLLIQFHRFFLQRCMTFRNTLSLDFITKIHNYCTMSSSLLEQNKLTLQADSLRLWHVFRVITVAKHIRNFYRK